TLDHARGMAVFLIAAILTPVGVMSFQQNVISSQAAPSIQILNIETNIIDDQTALFSFDSDVSATIYLEVTDVNTQEMTPILPANNLDKRMSHSFLIPNVENKEIVFSVNGKRFFYEGKPYRIEKQP
nr:hypothetical protein [Candidatus Woesebacteria bacterium]